MFERYAYYAGVAYQPAPQSLALGGPINNNNCTLKNPLNLSQYVMTITGDNGNMQTQVLPIYIIDGTEYLYNPSTKEFVEANSVVPLPILGNCCFTPINKVLSFESATDEEKITVLGIAGTFAVQSETNSGVLSANQYAGQIVNGYSGIKIRWHKKLEVYYYYVTGSVSNALLQQYQDNVTAVSALIAIGMYTNDNGLYWTRAYALQVVTIYGVSQTAGATEVQGGQLLTLNAIVISMIGILGIIATILTLARAYGRKEYVTMASLLIPMIAGYALSGLQLFIGMTAGIFGAIEYYLYDKLSVLILLVSELVYVVAAGILEFASMYEFAEFLANTLFTESIIDFLIGLSDVTDFSVTGQITTGEAGIPNGFTISADYETLAQGILFMVQGALDFLFANAAGITGMVIVATQLVLGYGLIIADVMWTSVVPAGKYEIKGVLPRY
ncbi:MAG: hypothetical protein [aquatic viral metagenome]